MTMYCMLYSGHIQLYIEISNIYHSIMHVYIPGLLNTATEHIFIELVVAGAGVLATLLSAVLLAKPPEVNNITDSSHID